MMKLFHRRTRVRVCGETVRLKPGEKMGKEMGVTEEKEGRHDFFPELKKALPTIIRPSDRKRDAAIGKLCDMLIAMKGMTERFEFNCVGDGCEYHCCKPCTAWVWQTETILEEHLHGPIREAYSGNPTNAFYDPATGCRLPWEARPVNCLVFICPRMHPIERTMFEQLVARPMKAIRRFIWEVAHAQSPAQRAYVMQKLDESFEAYPEQFERNLTRLLEVVQGIKQARDREREGST